MYVYMLCIHVHMHMCNNMYNTVHVHDPPSKI